MSSDNSYSLFNNRILYKDSAFSGKSIEPVDIWKDRTLWGKVDECGHAIHINPDVMEDRVKKVQPNNPVLVLDFVANAFKYLQDSFTMAQTFGHIKVESAIQMKPKKGLLDMNSLYAAHIESTAQIIINTYLSDPARALKIRNFDDFLEIMKNFIREFSFTLPLTKSSMIKSKYSSPLISGMVIELSDNDYNDNAFKTRWINDPNFDFYLNTSRKVGFLVDENIPWRLVANLRSPNLDKHFMPQDLETTGFYEERIFHNYFIKAYLNDIRELKNNMKQLYNRFVRQYPFFKDVDLKVCKSGRKKVTQEMGARRSITDSGIEDIGDTYWLQFYFHLKMHEKNLQFSEQKIKEINRNIVRRKKNVDFSSALRYINYIVNGSRKCHPRRVLYQKAPVVADLPPLPLDK
jgi:hypothetical protein